MKAVATKKLREALAGLTREGHDIISRSNLQAKLGITDRKEWEPFREVLKRMVYTGEVKAEGRGRYAYVFEAAPPSSRGEGWDRLYRAVRISQGVFDKGQIMRMAVLSDSATGRMLQSLIGLGFIVKDGHIGSKVLYRGTKLLRETPDAPPEPRRERAPLNNAREMMAELNRLFLTSELSTASIRKKVLEQLILLQHELQKRGTDESENN
jgi:hypothetical protein